MYADPKELERLAQRDQDERRAAADDFDAAMQKACDALLKKPEAQAAQQKPFRVTSLASSAECVRQCYMTHDGAASPPKVELVIGLDGATHTRAIESGMSVAAVVQCLRALAMEIEDGAFTRMENQR